METDLTTEEQLQKLNSRWKRIAGANANSPKWEPPSELQWRSWLRKVPFVVLYENCLRRLHEFRGSVKADASSYLGMIVDRNGSGFMQERGLSRPEAMPDEDDFSEPDSQPENDGDEEVVVFLPRRR